MPDPVRVVLVDDSPTFRLLMRRTLGREEGFEVVGEGRDGEKALGILRQARPDLALVDVMMPGTDGLELTRRAGELEHPPAIVIVSDLVGTASDLDFRAVEAGAVDVFAKPRPADLEPGSEWLASLAAIGRRAREEGMPKAQVESLERPQPKAPAKAPRQASSLGESPLVALGTSTGGPRALATILAALPLREAPVLCVQHMTGGMIDGMARWLDTVSEWTVRVATEREEPRPGVVYLAPDDAHLLVRGGRLRLGRGEEEHGHRPAVDVLFRSLADDGRGPSLLAGLLTGMGKDGAEGLLALRRAGALTVAQDEATSVVFGMPRAAIAAGAARWILPLGEIGPTLAANLPPATGVVASDRAKPFA